jgi:hypothetical protein
MFDRVIEYFLMRMCDAAFWFVIIWSIGTSLYFLAKSIIGYLLGGQESKSRGVDDE